MRSKRDGKLSAFELARFKLETYPEEQITYAKFLDDNDPRLILLVTYDYKQSTTYMKVVKIEKTKSFSKWQATVGNVIHEETEKEKTLTDVEETSIAQLKDKLIEAHQQNMYRNGVPSSQIGIPENLKGTMTIGTKKNEVDLSIVSNKIRHPLRVKTEFDPQSDFETVLLQQIDEMERQEFQEESKKPEAPSQADLTSTSQLVPEIEEEVKEKSERKDIRLVNKTDSSMNTTQALN